MKRYRVITMLLAVLMSLSFLSFTAFAEDATSATDPTKESEQTTTTNPSGENVSGDWKYKVLTDKTVEIIGYTGTAAECLVPKTLDNKTVVSIASGIVKNNSDIVAVSIPGSVASLQPDSFMGCMALKVITVQSGSLQNFDIEYCPNLETISLPETVKTIGKLEQCPMLQKININEKNSALKSVDGVVYSADMKTLIKYPAGKISNSRFTLPATITAVGEYAFAQAGSNIKEIYIPASVTKIAENAFSGGTMTTVLFQAAKIPVDCEAAVKGQKTAVNQINVFAPTKVVSAQNTTTIKIEWSEVTGADGYAVYYRTAKGWKWLGNTAKTTATFTGLKAGAKFTFAIRSVVKTSDGLVGSQNYITHETSTSPVATSKIASANNDRAIKLTWAKVNGASGYAIYYKNSKGWQHYKNLTANTITISNLKAYTTYTFAVRTLIKTADKIVAGNYKEIAVRTNIGTPVAKVSQKNTTSINLTWGPSAGASHYAVYYKVNNSDWIALGTYNEIKSLTISGLKKGLTITLAVRGLRSDGKTIVAKSAYEPVSITLK